MKTKIAVQLEVRSISDKHNKKLIPFFLEGEQGKTIEYMFQFSEPTKVIAINIIVEDTKVKLISIEINCIEQLAEHIFAHMVDIRTTLTLPIVNIGSRGKLVFQL